MHKKKVSFIEGMRAAFPDSIDLTNSVHGYIIFQAANMLLKRGFTLNDIDELEEQFKAHDKQDHIFYLMVLKTLRSKLLVSQISKPLFVSVVFAVYKEHNRIKSKRQHPHGENFLLKKVDQLAWLFKDNPNINWQLTVVDDGCPENSGEIAQGIIDKYQLEDRSKVIFLRDGIVTEGSSVNSLEDTSGSQKGGSIRYGMWDAIQQHGVYNHIVVFTDADLSTHLGQIGLLIGPILKKKRLASIGSRREPQSIVLKKSARNDRGKLFIYLWKRLIPNLNYIIDTQCGFKAFDATIIPQILEDPVEFKFAFDIELLLKTELIQSQSIEKVPIAWIDSEEASTTTDIQPYLPMLKAIVRIYSKYLPEDDVAEDFVPFIETLSDKDFDALIRHIPKEITKREPFEFNDFSEVTATDLAACIPVNDRNR